MQDHVAKILQASPYYLEDVKGLDLERRSSEGKLSFILLNQPPVCDYHCKRCFMPTYRRAAYHPAYALTLSESQQILQKAKDQGVLCLEVSGEGEPLLSKDLTPLVLEANNVGLMTTLITNGNTLTKSQTKQFRDNNVTLVFSMHTLDPKKYEQDNQCKGSFDRKLRHIDLAAEVYHGTKRYEHSYDVYRLAVHATLQGDNSEEIQRLKAFCHERDIFFSIAPLALTGSALLHPEIHPVNGEKQIEEVVLLGDNSIVHSHSSRQLLGREVCGTALYGLNIGWDGSLLFDAHYGYEVGEQNLLGNIREIPFERVVSQQRRYMRLLFENIAGSCPVRDPMGKEFLRKVLKSEIDISTVLGDRSK